MGKKKDISAVRIGEHLIKAIDDSPYSQNMVAGELCIDPKTLWRYLYGSTRAPYEIIEKIARICKDDSIIVKCAAESELCYAVLPPLDYKNIDESYTHVLDASAELPRVMPALFSASNNTEKMQAVEKIAKSAIKGWWEILAHAKQGGTP